MSGRSPPSYFTLTLIAMQGHQKENQQTKILYSSTYCTTTKTNQKQCSLCVCVFLKKNQSTPRPSEHPPVMGGGNVKTFRWDQRLQIQNLFMQITLGQQYNVGEKPTVILYINSGHQVRWTYQPVAPVAQRYLTRWDVSSIPANGIFLTEKLKNGNKTSRALSLRNLVSGNECWRVFPAGVEPGSPSRYAAN